MAKCNGCKEEADELMVVKVLGKKKKLCEECAEIAAEEAEIAEMSEEAVRGMMGYKGKW